MKKIVKKMFRIVKRMGRVIPNLSKVNGVIQSESYYPELSRKSKMRRRLENIAWVLKNDEVNSFYNLYGLDVKGSNKAGEYSPYSYFMRTRDEKNLRLESNSYNYTVLLRDKYLFEKYLNSFGIKTANTIAVIKNGKIFDKDLNGEISEGQVFIDEKKRFIKSVDGECADGVFTATGTKEYRKKLDKLVTGQRYLVQEQLVQHATMNKLNPNSVNTLRLITVKTGDGVQLFGALQRIGVSKSGDVDNWAVGGLDVEIDKKSGKLMKYGFYKPGYGTKTTTHPDTGILLEGFEIPYYDEAVELVKRAHEKIYGVHSIGWDVAITKDGPVLVEGNDNYEISMLQLNNGLRKEWKKINAQ